MNCAMTTDYRTIGTINENNKFDSHDRRKCGRCRKYRQVVFYLSSQSVDVKCEYGRLEDPCKKCAERHLPCGKTDKIFGPKSSREISLSNPRDISITESRDAEDREIIDDYEVTRLVHQIATQSEQVSSRRINEDLRRLPSDTTSTTGENRDHFSLNTNEQLKLIYENPPWGFHSTSAN